MRVAVTGATGFIGKYILMELSKYSVNVVALVRHTTSTPLKECHGELVQVDL
ncbi:NAD-dependent epimerase/dehydratase family protein [Laspinema olomoucense]|uniref:NAD-dependent epimerase/dehydratase family protein n=1 Tax=Laspinema olomoucense TaxID=3231600 RepID=UPI0021BAC05B|nr:NAD-dependent epimerase/dehydratase family protein [Laspinema sp. D3a]MCT7990066.1 NAD-dependent epimerase/dehydratase family protein [Laspinema sp. D3a]